jgi:hypothetical protein
MRSRVQVIFWSAVVVAVVLLGVTWTLAQRLGAGDASVEDAVLLAVAAAGMAAAALVAARIVFVIGRLRRRARQDTRR